MAILAPRRLRQEDDLTAFSCGLPIVDQWARTRAWRAFVHGTAVTYVSCDGPRVAGLYSLSSHGVARYGVDAGGPRRNTPGVIPVTLLGMLGVDRAYQGRSLGASLLADAIERSLGAAAVVGSRALVVDAATPEAQMFYEHFGFKALTADGASLYLLLKR